jgi:hypothetical protein
MNSSWEAQLVKQFSAIYGNLSTEMFINTINDPHLEPEKSTPFVVFLILTFNNSNYIYKYLTNI